jgi:hypothetical protein
MKTKKNQNCKKIAHYNIYCGIHYKYSIKHINKTLNFYLNNDVSLIICSYISVEKKPKYLGNMPTHNELVKRAFILRENLKNDKNYQLKIIKENEIIEEREKADKIKYDYMMNQHMDLIYKHIRLSKIKDINNYIKIGIKKFYKISINTALKKNMNILNTQICLFTNEFINAICVESNIYLNKYIDIFNIILSKCNFDFNHYINDYKSNTKSNNIIININTQFPFIHINKCNLQQCKVTAIKIRKIILNMIINYSNEIYNIYLNLIELSLIFKIIIEKYILCNNITDNIENQLIKKITNANIKLYKQNFIKQNLFNEIKLYTLFRKYF